MGTWSKLLISLLQNTKDPLSTVLTQARQTAFSSHSLECHFLLSSLLRDNMLSLPMRLLALLLLNEDSSGKEEYQSKFLYMVFDILDASVVDVERWLCYSIVTRDAYSPSVLAYSADQMAGAISELVRLFPVTNDIVQKVEYIKHEYYREQLSSPDILPFMSLDSSCFVNTSYPLHALDLEEYASFFEDHSDMLMFYTPSFDRPLFSHTPTRDDFIILHPSLSSNSFLYVPITKEEVMSKEPPEELRQCWTSSLSKNAIDRILSDGTKIHSLFSYIASAASSGKSATLTSLVELNPDLGRGLVDALKKNDQEELCYRLLFELNLSPKSLDFVNSLLKMILIPKEVLVQYVKQSVKRLCGDSSQEVGDFVDINSSR